MPMKNILIIFFSLFFLEEISSHEIIEKYGKKTTNEDQIFLDISGFNKGDNIYISISTKSYAFNSYLYYNFYEEIDNIDSFSASLSVYQSSSSTVSTYDTYKETYNYKITKNDANSKYLYMTYYFDPPVTIENTEKDGSAGLLIIIIAVVGSFIFIAVFITILICCCRRCRKTSYIAAYPNSVGYGISSNVGQPVIPVVQPDMQSVVNVQPYGTGQPPNQNYNYAPDGANNQDLISAHGIDYRIDKQQNYEKLM